MEELKAMIEALRAELAETRARLDEAAEQIAEMKSDAEYEKEMIDSRISYLRTEMYDHIYRGGEPAWDA